jgi:hypothetical protein
MKFKRRNCLKCDFMHLIAINLDSKETLSVHTCLRYSAEGVTALIVFIELESDFPIFLPSYTICTQVTSVDSARVLHCAKIICCTIYKGGYAKVCL